MNIHIITSSYPQDADDPSGTAGLFVRQFAVELAAAGHHVVVQPAARKNAYQADPGIIIVPTPWRGGDQELASMSFLAPRNWLTFLRFFVQGAKNTTRINKDHDIDRTLCMWAAPSGVFGWLAKLRTNAPYDVWVLGSDIWRIRKVPVLGRMILTAILRKADRVFADGVRLSADVTDFTGAPCSFLPSSRVLPPPKERLFLSDPQTLNHVLFVGRYHPNKGPDILIKAVARLSDGVRKSVRVHMFGLGPLEHELKALIAKHRLEDCVKLLGPIQAQELSDCLGSVSFLAIPSRIESIPLVFSDAIQRGTPVVATPVGDLGALIAEYRCGVVAEEVTPQSFAVALETALRRGKDLFREGAVRAHSRFKIKSAVDAWLEHSN